jgi:YbgC/YbaW family acyl-CoA thioester hydrolase
MLEFTQRIDIPFADTDMAGVVHFSRFFVYMESAEHAFLRSLGCEIWREQDDGSVHGWPRSHASCDYRAPVRFGDSLDVQVQIAECAKRSLRLRFAFAVVTDAGATPAAEGEVVIVHAALDRSTGDMTPLPLPPALVAVCGGDRP